MKLRLYLADVVEPLANGKLAMLGVYPDLVIVMHVPPGTPDPSLESAYGTDVCLMVVLSDLPLGKSDGELQVFHSSERATPLLRARFGFEVPAPGASINLPMPLRPLPVPKLGEFIVDVHVGDQVQSETFEVRARIDPGAPPPTMFSPTAQNPAAAH